MRVKVKICNTTLVIVCYLFLICLLCLSINAAPNGIMFPDGDERRPEQKIINELNSLAEERDLYDRIIQSFLKPENDAKKLEDAVSALSATVTENHKTISEIKEKLNTDRWNANASLQRQEDELAKLEPQVAELHSNWLNQTSELSQLKLLWNELNEKAVARAAEAQALRQSGQELDRHLDEQQIKVQQQETTVQRLEETLQNADETMLDLKKDLEEAFNSQGRLERQLEDLKSELDELRAGEAKVVSAPGNTRADSLCRSLGLV